VNPNERQQGELRLRKRESAGGVTPDGLIWGTALRETPFLHAAALFLAHVHSAHRAQNALLRNKNGCFDAARINVNRP